MTDQNNETMARIYAVQAFLREEGVSYNRNGCCQDGHKAWAIEQGGVIRELPNGILNNEVSNLSTLSPKCLALIEEYGSQKTEP